MVLTVVPSPAADQSPATPLPRRGLAGESFWAVTSRHGVAVLRYLPTEQVHTVPTVFEAWRLAREEPVRALAEMAAALPADGWQTLHTELSDTAARFPASRDPHIHADAAEAVLALESIPTFDGICVYRCVCGGWLTELGVSAQSAPVIGRVPVGYRHLDACDDCYQWQQQVVYGRRTCRDWNPRRHPAPWTFDTRCELVAPAECSRCYGGLRVDMEPCERGHDDCCGCCNGEMG